MRPRYGFLVFVFLLLVAGAAEVISQEDAQGCKDHPLFTRMANFHIQNCERSEFDRHEFSSEGGPIAVEGKKTIASYFLKDGAQGPTGVAIVRNYMNAIKKIGGTIVYDGGDRATLKVTKGKQEIWAGVNVVGVNGTAVYEYRLDIVEKGEMQQQIVASAEVMTNDITTRGHAAMYGIHFDTGKSEIKPESESALKEIAKVFKQNPTMKLFVVGHTDNVGGIGPNMTLSRARAESVAKELTANYGVSAKQLTAYGVGSLSPVAPNATDEGRALNRRVELVEQ